MGIDRLARKGTADMGISTNIYVVYGVRTGWHDEFMEVEMERTYDDPDAPRVIADGMGGDYMVMGEVLFDSGDFRWGMENGDWLGYIDLASLPEIEQAYRERWARYYPDHLEMINQPFRLFAFTHLS